MISAVATYTRMMVELLIAIFLTGLLAAVFGGAAYVISDTISRMAH